MAVVAARWRRRPRRIHAMAGPMAKAARARLCGKAERGEAGAGQVEELDMESGSRLRRDERGVSDVWDEGEVARGVEAVGEGCGDGEPMVVKAAWAR